MKRIFSIILVLFSVNTFAQTDGSYNYSVGVGGYNLMQLPKIFQQVNDDDYTSSTFNRGIIKFNDNQISYRISGHFLKKENFSFKNNCNNCETVNGTVKDFAVKIGFEKNFNYSSIQPFFGFDFGYRSNSYAGNLEPSSMSSAAAKGIVSDKRGGTISPIIGFKINATKQISIFAESSLDFFYMYERQETADPFTSARTFNKYNKLEMLLNPVSVGLQIQLISKN